MILTKPIQSIAIFVAVFIFVSLNLAQATEEYAEATGKQCVICHIDPLGGGELNEFGKGYFLSVSPETVPENMNKGTLSRVVRFVFIYIHIITAFMWFGTILYVHLVLKPAYASKGLPRGEVRVGLVSMVIMAITGVVLTYYKVPALSLLVSSKFGILLLIKISIFMIMVLSALYVVFFIGPRLKGQKNVKQVEAGRITLDELESYDGQEGRPAYFAYKGKVYDVSQSRLWNDGVHMARHHAGTDLTEILSQAPHDEEKILAMPEIGRLDSSANPAQENLHKKVFFKMAYMNLGLVFIVSLILALWKW